MLSRGSSAMNSLVSAQAGCLMEAHAQVVYVCPSSVFIFE